MTTGRIAPPIDTDENGSVLAIRDLLNHFLAAGETDPRRRCNEISDLSVTSPPEQGPRVRASAPDRGYLETNLLHGPGIGRECLAMPSR